MKTLFDTMQVNYAEYSYFKKLPKAEKIQFLFELYEGAEIRSTKGIDLGRVFDMIKESLSESIQYDERPKELPQGVDYVEVLIDDDNVMVESNSIKAIRQIVYRFFESGYILQRDKDMEKMFKRDKITRYLRIFRIINQVSVICTN
jgi:hypothetical protein